MANAPSKIVRFRRKGGTDSVLQRMASEHELALRRFLSARLSGHPDHEDLVQETFLRVARQDNVEEKLTRGIDSVRSYLFSIATNLVRDRYRKGVTRQKYDHLVTFDADGKGAEASAEQVVAAQEQLQAVKVAITKLSPECRDAFVLSRFKGLSYREIADRMDISSSMVEKHIMRALKGIRRRVDRD